MLTYESQHPLYGIAFSHSPSHPHRAALTTCITGPTNKLLVVDPIQTDFRLLASINLAFPATKVGWEPTTSVTAGQNFEDGRPELLATTGDVLRLWDMQRTWDEAENGRSGYAGSNGSWANDAGYVIKSRSVLSNTKSSQLSLPPITSFAWNPTRPESIVTCSIDTTATLWDINTSQAITQLIAHDRAVFDLAWLPQSPDIFVSVGADGSLRAFDLRQLEHSTILYESAGDTKPLARIGFSNTEQHMLACFGVDDHKTLILDMRSPGQPVAELIGHKAPLQAIGWGAGGAEAGSGGGWIASCGDDGQLLLYDLTGPLPEGRSIPSNLSNNGPSPNYTLTPSGTPSARTPSPKPSAVDIMPRKAWTAEAEINNLAFTDKGDAIGCVTGQKLHLLPI